MWKSLLLLTASLFIVGCQPSPSLHDFYAPKQQRLTQILDYCKANGMHYAQTNATCKKAATKGIYWDLPHYYKHCCCCTDRH
jgi:hypothetical protein